jgi:hypothetical protein
LRGETEREKTQEKNKKATIKRMSIIFNIKTKRNKIKWKGVKLEEKNNLKKNPKQKKTNEKKKDHN